jgi:hypothetical protein
VQQKKGSIANTEVWTGLKQQRNFYSLLQNQVRFASDSGLSGGNVDGPTWNGLKINAVPDILDQDWYHVSMDDVFVITGEQITKPTWMSDIEGAGGRLRWNQGTTAFSDAIVYPFQIGIQRRNTHAAAVGLTA